jgi:hypothetical protein
LQSVTFLFVQLDQKLFLTHGHLLKEECAMKSIN